MNLVGASQSKGGQCHQYIAGRDHAVSIQIWVTTFRLTSKGTQHDENVGCPAQTVAIKVSWTHLFFLVTNPIFIEVV